MIKIGLVGVGHLGKIHFKLLRGLASSFEVVGFYDQDPSVQTQVAEQFGVRAYPSFEALLGDVDAIDLVVPTLYHHQMASQAIAAGKHLFIEKPVTHTVPEAEELLRLSQAHPDLVIQVGHVERFNPAMLAIDPSTLAPVFIEGHRLAVYNPRGTDVSVILDLMIHDLDIVLSLIPAEVASIHASGVAVISEGPDIANARIEFANGCVANLTASRISIKNMRRLRLFQKNNYLALDFLKKETEVLSLTALPADPAAGVMQFPLDNGAERRYLRYEKPEVQPINAIEQELHEFADSIQTGAPVRVSLYDGVRAVRVAHRILAKIEEGLQRMGATT